MGEQHSCLARVGKCLKCVLNGGFQPGQIISNDLPYSLEVDSQVIVHKHVAKRRDGPPLHLGMRLPYGLGEPLGRLGQSL